MLRAPAYAGCDHSSYCLSRAGKGTFQWNRPPRPIWQQRLVTQHALATAESGQPPRSGILARCRLTDPLWGVFGLWIAAHPGAGPLFSIRTPCELLTCTIEWFLRAPDRISCGVRFIVMKPCRQFDLRRSRKLVALLGVLIIGLFATVQAVHAHPSGTVDSHCSICMSAHGAVAVVALPSLPVLDLIRAEVPQFAPQRPYIAPSATPSIRPPPATA